MDSVLYKAIKQQVIDNLPQFKYVALWNNQLHNERKEKAFDRPAMLIEFMGMTYDDYTQGVDRVQGKLRLHCCFNVWKAEDDLAILDTMEQVSLYIDGFTPLYYSPFNRIAEEMDANHDAVVDWMIDFTISGTIMTNYSDLGKVKVQLAPDLAGQLVEPNEI